jgi:hypothetical protein
MLMELNDVGSTSKLVTAISSKPLLTMAASAKSLRINSIAMLDLVSTLVSSLLGVSGVILLLLAEQLTALVIDSSSMQTVIPLTALIFQSVFKCKFPFALLTVSSIMATGRIALVKDTVAVMCLFQFRLRTVADLALHAKWSAMIALHHLLDFKNAGSRIVMKPNKPEQLELKRIGINKVSQ